ncbi:MAG: response regulator transcription factor [Marinovum sp.]|nr:response regulator transcription factor [Marinovum sp.]
MQILLADDHQLIRDVMIAYMHASHGIEVVPASTRDEALKEIKTNGPFACALVDLRMPGVRSAFDLLPVVEANAPNPVLLFSGAATFSDLFAAQRLGMIGFIQKTMPAKDVARVVVDVINGSNDLPPMVSFTSHMKAPCHMPDMLSEEDCLILGMVADGARNSEIANGLGLTRSRVENRLRKIYKAIGVSSRLAAANFVNAQVM